MLACVDRHALEAILCFDGFQRLAHEPQLRPTRKVGCELAEAFGDEGEQGDGPRCAAITGVDRTKGPLTRAAPMQAQLWLRSKGQYPATKQAEVLVAFHRGRPALVQAEYSQLLSL
jgi:hypothetical protein